MDEVNVQNFICCQMLANGMVYVHLICNLERIRYTIEIKPLCGRDVYKFTYEHIEVGDVMQGLSMLKK